MNVIANTSEAATAFHAVFSKAKEIQFNPNWSTNSGYDYATRGKDAPKLEVGEIVKTTDGADTINRRILIVSTPLGNVVVHERYPSNHGSTIFAYSATSTFQRNFSASLQRPLTTNNIITLLGDGQKYGRPNIGTWLKDLMRSFTAYSAEVEAS